MKKSWVLYYSQKHVKEQGAQCFELGGFPYGVALIDKDKEVVRFTHAFNVVSNPKEAKRGISKLEGSDPDVLKMASVRELKILRGGDGKFATPQDFRKWGLTACEIVSLVQSAPEPGS